MGVVHLPKIYELEKTSAPCNMSRVPLKGHHLTHFAHLINLGNCWPHYRVG